MKITEDIIERFFNNACDEDERQAVKNFFIRHPERLEAYMTDASWKEYKQEATLPTEVSKKMIAVIRNLTYANARKMNQWRWAAAAAVLLLVTSTVWLAQFNKQQPVQPLAKQQPVPATPSTSIKQTSNNTSKAIWLTLEDGSKVKLEPGAELVYSQPFPVNSRSINMKGRAVFHVASDPAKPFTVHAGQLSTTALGTVFSVDACKGKTTRVRLLSGKIRVDPDSSLIGRGLKSAILLPGQELKLNAMDQWVITKPQEKSKKNIHTAPAKQLLPVPKTDVHTFHNEPLANIFTALAEEFNTIISFKPDQLAGMTFTGKFNKEKETLFDFIQTISSLNNLTAVDQNGTIQILVQ